VDGTAAQTLTTPAGSILSLVVTTVPPWHGPYRVDEAGASAKPFKTKYSGARCRRK